MENQFSISLKNNISEVARLAEFIETLCEKNKLKSSSIFEINLVLEEIFVNIIMHGFNDTKQHLIEICISIDSNAFFAQIIDDGIEFNPLNYIKDDRTAPLEEKGIGGLGIHIIKKYMDKIKYERIENKNILSINKLLNPVQ